jgi:hypothetical protein
MRSHPYVQKMLLCSWSLASAYNATAKRPKSAAATPNSSFPAAPVDSATRPVEVPLAPAADPEPVGFEGVPVIEGALELPDGTTMTLPDPVADALLPDAVAEADPEDLGISVARGKCKPLFLLHDGGTPKNQCPHLLHLTLLLSMHGTRIDGCTYKPSHQLHCRYLQTLPRPVSTNLRKTLQLSSSHPSRCILT